MPQKNFKRNISNLRVLNCLNIYFRQNVSINQTRKTFHYNKSSCVILYRKSCVILYQNTLILPNV